MESTLVERHTISEQTTLGFVAFPNFFFSVSLSFVPLVSSSVNIKCSCSLAQRHTESCRSRVVSIDKKKSYFIFPVEPVSFLTPSFANLASLSAFFSASSCFPTFSNKSVISGTTMNFFEV